MSRQLSASPNRGFEFDKSRQQFIRVHNETLPVVATPMWLNGRRNGLKIVVLVISLLCVAYQISPSLPG
jgi:hypothetical protein